MNLKPKEKKNKPHERCGPKMCVNREYEGEKEAIRIEVTTAK